ncbi:glutarate-semialdehyde dehydrogenase DavD [Elstera cyanobacteriorum]|uniref:Succinate-semialdehyde dehydrogenase (NADP(+)) n=1 Tax=Elstera cyanobacteriorum TaxID=2022747 RepID=A0A255XWP9_9PROT|nr:NAD-dependent succinate-semialdehyde dehydrogenase [Elstera cyanobacteriorum]OYQ21406.1 succinate-semialdehyde dehydrogenase (NADP(+)) [Elstera cyanobacteriorum]GFZ96802.1 glutarate-semialdehyde dehydrogenase DavD [Elstera cyanobacteriorum]
MNLTDTALFRQQAYINGQWVGADTGGTLAVDNPATGVLIGTVPNMGAAETRRAIEAAGAAFPLWAAKTAKERSIILTRWAELIVQNVDDLAVLMTSEQGKPLAEARGEILSGAAYIQWFAEEGRRVYGDVIPQPRGGQRLLVVKQPVGVCGAITPWNFPSSMIARKAGAALAVGCTLVVKPSDLTPFSALALAELAERAGLPAGVLNIVIGDAAPIGDELSFNPIVKKITFTGSTAVGKLLLSKAAQTVKKVSMELGGNAPFIVFDDADLDAAVAGAILSKFRNAGQTCVCANRVFVQEGIYEAFAAKFTAATQGLKVGNGLDTGTTTGPLIDDRALAKVERMVAEATEKGARVLTGGTKHALGGRFYTPTVLADVTGEMSVVRDEIFGPVAPLVRFKDEADVIRLANDTDYGLAAYFYARDLGRVWRVAEALEYGMVAVNEGAIATEVAPFGGIKQSGMGREGSKYGVDDYIQLKFVTFGGIGA